MILINANIFTKDCEFCNCNVEVKDEKVNKIIYEDIDLNSCDAVFDCQGQYLIPGLVDIHFHGCMGHDFCEAQEDAILEICDYEARNGVLAICPATMTYTEDILTPVMDAAAKHINSQGSDLVGINMEGPFISKDKLGAQNPEFVQTPNFDMLTRLQKHANGLIKLVDIAPEEENGLDFIKKASNEFNVSIAHTCCDYGTAKKAFELGANHLTHTFNAMPPISHRSPGPIPAAAEEGAYVELICDGMHIDYSIIRLAFKIFDKKNICLISDSCEATGLSDGTYSIGGQGIIKRGNKVVLEEKQDTIAASATNLFDCMRHAIFDAGIKKEDAIAASTINPAKSIGVDNLYGSIEPKKIANFVLVNDNFDIIKIFRHGLVLDC